MHLDFAKEKGYKLINKRKKKMAELGRFAMGSLVDILGDNCFMPFWLVSSR